MTENLDASIWVCGVAESLSAEIAHSLDVGIAISDQSDTLLFVNEELARMTGYGAQELLGQPVRILLPDRYHGHHGLERETWFADRSTRRIGLGGTLFARRRDGSELPVEIGLRHIETSVGTVVVASVIDVSERRRLESNFGAVVESAPYGMLLTDARGKITMANRKVCEMFGYASADLLGQRVEILLPERHRIQHVTQREGFAKAPVQRSMGGGRDLTGRRKDGREFPVEIGLSSVQTVDGPMALAAVVDITTRKRAELDLREANAQLEEFTYVASHDLKSPMRGIANLLEWIKEDLGEAPPEAVVKNLDRMESRVTRMERLIEDLLTYARAGRRTTQVERISVPQMVQEIVDLDPVPAGMQLTVDLRVDEIEGACMPLATTLRNLYTNAVKHHDKPNGHIAIEAWEEGSYCVFSVTDDGPGIPNSAQARVFRLFQTLTATERKGTGLGLAVAKRLVENHGGRIELTSRLDPTGCTFRVWWPRFTRSDLND
jgi:PAS domain S-box-containing protein